MAILKMFMRCVLYQPTYIFKYLVSQGVGSNLTIANKAPFEIPKGKLLELYFILHVKWGVTSGAYLECRFLRTQEFQ